MKQKDHFRLQREHTICVVIDLQTQLMSAMQDRIISETEKNTGLLIASLKILNVPIVVTEQYPRGLGPTSDTIKQALDDLYIPVEKVVFSCWNEPLFRKKISAFKPGNIILTGIETHVCVLQTALDMLTEGYNVYIPVDTTCSRYKSDWKSALAMLDRAGAVITSVETVIFQLLEKAGTPEFKAISPLIKERDKNGLQ